MTTMRFLSLLTVGYLTLSSWVSGEDASSTSKIMEPSDPFYYDQLRNVSSNMLENVSFTPGSNIFRIAVNDGSASGTQQIRLAEFKAFLPLSNGTHIRYGYKDDVVAALLAVYHFNNIDISPILQPQDIAGCDLKLTMEIVDSKFSPIGSTRTFTESLRTPNTLSTPLPTAVIGAYRSATTSPLAILTGVNGIPQASYAAASTDFDVKEQFPLFGRTVASSTGDANVILNYFLSTNATHVGVLFVSDSYGSSLQKAFQDAANDAGLVTSSVAFSFSANQGKRFEIENAIVQMKKTQFRIFFVICFEDHLEPIIKTALDYDIIGKNFSWILTGMERSAVEPILSGRPIMARAAVGMGFVNAEGDVRKEPVLPQKGLQAPLEDFPETGYEKFRTFWRTSRADPDFLRFVQSKLPVSLNSMVDFDRTVPWSKEPGSFRPMLYDAVIGMALAMCRAGSVEEFCTGSQIFNEWRQLIFEGASGKVHISNETGTRNFESLKYAMWNIQLYENDKKGNPQIKMVPSRKYDNGVWVDIEGNPFIFADGTSNPPESLPPVKQSLNLIGNPGRYAAYALMGMAMFAVIATWLWMFWFWRERVVSSSQPLFLILVSIGCFVMVSAIIPLSFDEELTEDESALDRACVASPWLYTTGAVIALSALFAKTRGVHKVYMDPELDFIHVTSFDIFGTLVSFLTLNTIVLVTWTAIDPSEWARTNKDTTDVFNRPVESYGSCSDEGSLPYIIVLFVTNFFLLFIGNWWAYQCRNIETEYLESRYIRISLAAVLQAWCMGIPILIVVWDTPQAKFFVETGIIFVTSLAFLLLIFVPKVIASISDRKEAITAKKRNAYYGVIEGRVKRENDYDYDDDDEDDQGDAGLSESSVARDNRESTLKASQENTSAQSKSLERNSVLKRPQGKLLRSSFSRGKVDPDKVITKQASGLKILHNPKSERNLNIAHGLAVSRRQLDHYCEDRSNCDNGDEKIRTNEDIQEEKAETECVVQREPEMPVVVLAPALAEERSPELEEDKAPEESTETIES